MKFKNALPIILQGRATCVYTRQQKGNALPEVEHPKLHILHDTLSSPLLTTKANHMIPTGDSDRKKMSYSNATSLTSFELLAKSDYAATAKMVRIISACEK